MSIAIRIRISLYKFLSFIAHETAERLGRVTEAIIDFLLRYQRGIVAGLALPLAGVMLFPYLRLLLNRFLSVSAPHESAGTVSTISFAGADVIPRLLAVVLLGTGASIPLFGFDPVSRSAFLSLPTPVAGIGATTADSNGNRDKRNLLIFIHGWSGSDKTWKKFHELAKSDHDLDADLLTVNYPQFMLRRQLDVSGLSDWLDEKLHTNRLYESYDKIAIVAHSMGGLIARRISVLSSLTRGDPKPIGFLAEIGTPHQGADLAGIADKIGLGGELTEDMEKDSKFLTLLQKDWSRLGERPDTRPFSFCLYSPQDGVVEPSSARAGCDSDRPYTRGGHRAIVRPVDLADERYQFPIFRVKHYFSR